MAKLSSYLFPEVYTDLNIDIKTLGCVMLDTEPLPKLDISEDMLYYSPTQQYAQGYVASRTPHVTGLYGIMPGVERVHVDEVLEGRIPDEVLIDYVDYFPAPVDEPYVCVVAKVDPEWHDDQGRSLQEVHDRLSFLPHVNTFPGYQAHLTIAYLDRRKFSSSQELRDYADQLTDELLGVTLAVRKLNYGDQIN